MVWKADSELSVLVIDDDPGICSALKRILSTKYDVSVAMSIFEADKFLHDHEYAVIIIDYNLRDKMDGIKFAEYVKTISPLSYTLMLTGNSDFDIVQKALNGQNIDKFMIKPFETHELLSNVDVAQADYSSKKEIADMLQSDNGVKMAQNLLTQVFDEKIDINSNVFDLAGVVISRNSIPVYSRFLNNAYLKSFTDTIFSGFMTAIHMVGQEVFNNSTSVDTLKFGEISIYFKFYGQYQFCFIIRQKPDQPAPNQFKILDEFFNDIVSAIQEDPKYFSVNNDYMVEIDERLNEIKDFVVA